MPAHDWTIVDAGLFHHFHLAWIAELGRALNRGLLPENYYALVEQHAGEAIPDVLTLHSGRGVPAPPAPPLDSGGTLLADAPPKVRRQEVVEPGSYLSRRRTIAVRHVSGHRLVAMLEIVSPANKDRALNVAKFAEKMTEALEAGIHVLVLDVFPPGRHDPHGLHGAIRQHLERADEPYDGNGAAAAAPGEPLSLLSYAAGPWVEAYIEQVAVGAAFPDMPLFLRADRYVNVPLEATYQAAFDGMPAYWRDVLELRRTHPS